MEVNENVDSKEELEPGQGLMDSLNAMGPKDKKEVGDTMSKDPQVQNMVKEASLSFGGGGVKEGTISFGASNMEQTDTNADINKGSEGVSDDLYSKGEEILQGYAQAMGAEQLSPEMKANLEQTVLDLNSDNRITRAKAEATVDALNAMMINKQSEQPSQEEFVGGNESLTKDGKDLAVAIEEVQQAIANNNTESLTKDGKDLAVAIEEVQKAITDNNTESLTEDGKALAAVMNTMSNSNTEDSMTAEEVASTTDKGQLDDKDIQKERSEKVSKALADLAATKTGIYPINSPEMNNMKSLLNNSNLGMPDNLLTHNMVKVVNTPNGSQCVLSSPDGKNVTVMFNKADSTYKLTQDGKEISSGKSS